MHAPQIIWLLIQGAAIGANIVKRVNQKKPEFIVLDLFWSAAINALLWWGGFFNQG